MQEIPLNGRHFVDLGMLAPGSVAPSQRGLSTTPIRGTGALAFQTTGNREETVGYIVNGVTTNNLTYGCAPIRAEPEGLMNKRILRPIMVLALALLLSGSHLAAQDADPILGTWVLNVAKSTFSPGPGPRSESRTYIMETEKTKLTARGVAEPRTFVSVRQEIKATSQGVDGYGQPMTREWTIVRDGKDRPMAGDADVDMLSLTRIDAFTSAFTQKRAGRVVSTGTQAISRDGKVMTVTTTGINAKGQSINDVAVFDKQ